MRDHLKYYNEKMRFIVKIQLPEIDGHDDNYMKCFTFKNEVIHEFSSKNKELKKISNEEAEKYMRQLIKDVFIEGKMWDFESKKEVDLIKEDIDELPIAMLDSILIKLMGSDLKVR